MAITTGTRLGTYEIVSTLGAGGMGEVYLARDTKLGRSVAVKVLPELFLDDRDRIARFEREAKMLAALNHPYIAALHGMENSDGRHFLVMELVEGETLAERLRRGPMAVDLALVDRKGNVSPMGLPRLPYEYPRVSPDGARVVFGIDDGKEAAVSVHTIDGGSAMRKLTFGGANRYPIWSSDGRRVAFQSDRDGDRANFWQRADVSGAAERLTKPDPGTTHIPDAWSPDGKHMLFTVRKGLRFALWVLSVDDRKASPVGNVESPALPTAVFSHDGKWVAYGISEAGSNDTQLYVQAFPARGEQYQLFAKPGDNPHHPRWSSDGKEIFYVPRVGGFDAVTVTTQPNFAFRVPAPVPRMFPVAAPSTPRTFDLTRDGRIVSVIVADQDTPGAAWNKQPIDVVLNWTEELKARVSPK